MLKHAIYITECKKRYDVKLEASKRFEKENVSHQTVKMPRRHRLPK